MTVLGKALGGTALPVAAVVADGRLDSAPDLDLGNFTHDKSPLMARAALVTLEIIQNEKLAERAESLGSAGFGKMAPELRESPTQVSNAGLHKVAA